VVIYLNGVEIHRFGIAAGEVNFQSDATGHENAWEGPYEIPIANLLPGDNVLAAEVHQSGGSSSDMVFGAELIATIPGSLTPPPTETPKFTKYTRNTDGSITLEWTPGSGNAGSCRTDPRALPEDRMPWGSHRIWPIAGIRSEARPSLFLRFLW
jgi:hypothetical protein